jgi:hypothetical protein
MLNEAKTALRVTVDNFDGEIMLLLQAGARDLEIAGVRIPGRISWTVNSGTVNDQSNVRDPLVLRALFTYARAHFGSPADYERLKASYDEQKVQLMHAQDYTDYEATGGDCE